MRHKAVTILALNTSLFVFAIAVSAHHGNAAYDYDNKVTVSGTVTEWLWANPHCWLKLDAKDKNGGPIHWVIETSNPQDMARQGWARDSFKPGDEISLTIIAAKNGRSVGRAVGKDALLNGKPFPSGSANSSVPATETKP